MNNLFNLEVDPGETFNLFTDRMKESTRLKRMLAEWEKDVESEW